MFMRYDIVVAIYENEKSNIRTDSEFVCGGFESENEAKDYIRNNEINEYKYTYSDKEYPVIEIEVKDGNGNIKRIIKGVGK